MSEWGPYKASTPMGSIPIWEEDGFTSCNSSAILRILGIRLGYYSEDHLIAYKIDSIVEYMEDFVPLCNKFLLPAVMGKGAVDESKADEWLSTTWDKFIPVIEARLREHGKPFIAGTDRPTIADFKAFVGSFGGTDINSASVMPESIKAKIAARIAASASYSRWWNTMKAELASYIATRPPRGV